MADSTTLRYIFPPNLQATPDWEGDGHRRYILHMTNVSDGTGENAQLKFDLSEHKFLGLPLVRTVVEWIEYDIYGMDVELAWEREPGTVRIARLPGGSTTINGKVKGPLVDPGTGDGTDGTGNIILTTANHASGDSYDIRMSIKSKVDVKSLPGG